MDSCWEHFKAGWEGQSYISSSHGEENFPSSPSNTGMLLSTTTVTVRNFVTIDRFMHGVGNVLFWICCALTFGLAWSLVRGGGCGEDFDSSIEFSKKISESSPTSSLGDMNKSPSLGSKISDEKIFDEDAFLENFQLTNDSGMAVQSSSFKPSPVDFGTGTLAIQAMKQLVEIAVDNPQKVCQNMTHKQQIMLCYATQSNNEELQNQVLSLLKILAEYDANYALKLLMVEDGAERNIVHNIMFYGTDQVRILGLQLLIDLIKASGNEAENIQMIHDLLLDEGNDTNDYNPLCHVISRSSIAELAKTKLKVLELLNALPLNNESDVCFVLDLLESRPYEKYKSYLNALAHDCAANISTEIRRLTLQLNRMRNAHATVLTNIKLSDDCVGRIEAILKTV